MKICALPAEISRSLAAEFSANAAACSFLTSADHSTRIVHYYYYSALPL
jgi:hypothetical protein